MSKGHVQIEEWVDHVFDHPVSDPQWYWDLDAPELDPGPVRVATLIAETFENSTDLLGRFSDSQLNQGLWYLLDPGCSGYMCEVLDGAVSESLRRRTLESFVPLFEQTMASRCSPHLSHLDEQGANPLNLACYMWWDIMPFRGGTVRDRGEFEAQVLAVLRRLLDIPHDACRESALHGLGHWQDESPSVSAIIDEFLRSTPGLRGELLRYAEVARIGVVQ